MSVHRTPESLTITLFMLPKQFETNFVRSKL